jgi:hypothetical protein
LMIAKPFITHFRLCAFACGAWTKSANRAREAARFFTASRRNRMLAYRIVAALS